MKNPWLSMWLSGANAWSGAARGLATAEMRRTQNAMMAEGMRQATAFWANAAAAAMNGAQPPVPAKRKRRAASGASGATKRRASRRSA